MLVKLNSSLQTKNYMGLSDEQLDSLVKDLSYNYLRDSGGELTSERAGTILTISGMVLDIHKDYAVALTVNPALLEYGLVSHNHLLYGESEVLIKVRPFKAGSIELDYFYELRLLK